MPNKEKSLQIRQTYEQLAKPLKLCIYRPIWPDQQKGLKNAFKCNVSANARRMKWWSIALDLIQF